MRKEGKSWTTQQAEKSIVGCFGSLREKEGKTGWRSPENAGQVDLGFWYLGFWHLGLGLRLSVSYCNV
jgi:hypothetical protein